MASKKQAIIVADLLDNDEHEAEAFADAMADMVAAEGAADADGDEPTTGPTNESTHVVSFAVVPGSKHKVDPIADRADRAERLAREIPIQDRLGRTPSPDKVQASKDRAAAKEAKAATKAEPKVKTPKVLPLCQCGCGGRTGGGKFLPGHDAKLKSRLFSEARGTDEAARDVALVALEQRGWLHLMGDKKVAKPKAAVTVAQLSDAQRINQIETDLLWFQVGVVERTAIMTMVRAAIEQAHVATDAADGAAAVEETLETADDIIAVGELTAAQTETVA